MGSSYPPSTYYDLEMAMRTICPQVSGIYENNNADAGDPYSFLMLKNYEPIREVIATNAFKVNLSGEIDPEHEHPLDCFARDFGDFIRPICQQRPIDDELYDALDLVWQLATANCLDTEHDPDDDCLDVEIAQECRRQRAALDLVHDYLTNHW